MTTQPGDVDAAFNDDMLPEYDIDYSKTKPNRFAAALPSGARIMTLEADVAAVFSDDSVNAVLRALIATMPAGRVGQVTPQPAVVEASVSQPAAAETSAS